MANGNNIQYQPFGPFLEGKLRGERAWEILASCNYDLAWLKLLAYNVMSVMEDENNIEILQSHILQHATLCRAVPKVYQIVAELRRREAKIAKEQTSVRDLEDAVTTKFNCNVMDAGLYATEPDVLYSKIKDMSEQARIYKVDLFTEDDRKYLEYVLLWLTGNEKFVRIDNDDESLGIVVNQEIRQYLHDFANHHPRESRE